MGPQYGEILRDHGFNPTPLRALAGGALANLVPAGSHHGIVLLTLLDPLLEAGMFAAIAWAFGLNVMLLCMIYFCVLFGASFGYTGGAYLRYMWLCELILSVCCVRRQHHVAAGVLLAWSALLRIFPAFFVVPLACKAARSVAATHRVEPRYARFFVSFVTASGVLFAITLTLPRGLEQWREFTAKMSRHLASDAYNTIGLTEILAYHGATQPTTRAEFASVTTRRARIHLVQWLTIFPLTLFFVARRCGRENDSAAMAVGILLIFTALSVASYYYAFLLLLVLARARHLRDIVLLFATEAVAFSLTLFEDREVVLYFYRNVLLSCLLVALYVNGRTLRGARGNQAG